MMGLIRSLRSDRWTPWHTVAAIAMGVLGIVVTWDAWVDIHTIAANDEEYSHIFLVPVVAAWMVYVRRARIRYCQPTGTLLGLIIAALGWAISSYGFYHGHQSLWHGGSVMVVLGCVVSVLGRHAVFRFFPAVLVLVFLVPVPAMIRQQIAIPLQTVTAQVAQVSLQMVGQEVDRFGNQLLLNGVPVNIVEACNGLRMVFALILVTYAFAFGMPLRNGVRVVVLVLSPVAAIGCNVIRILPTVWLYGEKSEWSGNFHDVTGWLMLPVAFLLLLGILRALRWAMVPVMRYTLAGQ